MIRPRLNFKKQEELEGSEGKLIFAFLDEGWVEGWDSHDPRNKDVNFDPLPELLTLRSLSGADARLIRSEGGSKVVPEDWVVGFDIFRG